MKRERGRNEEGERKIRKRGERREEKYISAPESPWGLTFPSSG